MKTPNLKAGVEFRDGCAFVNTQLKVETQVGIPTQNQQQREMQPAGNVGGARPRMMPQNSRANPNFI